MPPERKPIILTWYPIIAVVILGFTSTAVDAYRLNQIESAVETRVSKATYEIQLAQSTVNSEKNAKDIAEIKALQQQQNDVRVRQEGIRRQLDENKNDIKALDNKMDDKFDDLKDFIRNNSRSGS